MYILYNQVENKLDFLINLKWLNIKIEIDHIEKQYCDRSGGRKWEINALWRDEASLDPTTRSVKICGLPILFFHGYIHMHLLILEHSNNLVCWRTLAQYH